jgi:hypothetical protein
VGSNAAPMWALLGGATCRSRMPESETGCYARAPAASGCARPRGLWARQRRGSPRIRGRRARSLGLAVTQKGTRPSSNRRAMGRRASKWASRAGSRRVRSIHRPNAVPKTARPRLRISKTK